MKSILSLLTTLLFAWSSFAGVGGIGGGTTKGGRYIQPAELKQMISYERNDVTIPQIQFVGQEAGLYFLSVDQVCLNGQILESIHPVEQMAYTNHESSTRNFRAVLQTEMSEGIPMDIPIGNYMYHLPDCQTVR